MFATKKMNFRSSTRVTAGADLIRKAPSASLPTKEQAFQYFGGSYDLLGSANLGSNVQVSGPLANTYMLTGLAPEQEMMLRKYYRDIYYYDTIAGSFVDIMSTFPFGSYTLTGADPSQLQKFEDSLDRINYRSFMPHVSTIYMVDGAVIASLLMSQKEKVLFDTIFYSIDETHFETLPFFSADPVIRVRTSESLRRFMASTDRHAMNIKAQFSPSMRAAFSAGAYRLDPVSTLYIERKTLPGAEPTSFLKRILPIYLLEKTLYRGTLVEVNKRQRSMLHIAMGDGDWEPTPQEMQETANQFQVADMDPLGAIVVTRQGISPSEIRQGGDFLKYTDMSDIFVPYKLRALGTSEAFLSGDSNFSNVESAMSLFMETSDSYREFLTFKTATNKIFPMVAVSNDMYKDAGVTQGKNIHERLKNTSNLVIPNVHWHKRLEAKDENVMDTLEKLEEKGVPIPLRMWAAAANVDINTLVHDLEKDEELRQKLEKYTGGRAGVSDSEDDSEYASLRRLSGMKRRPFLSRNFEHLSEYVGQTKTGKPKYIPNQKAVNEKANAAIAAAATSLKDPSRRAAALARVRKALGRTVLEGFPERKR